MVRKVILLSLCVMLVATGCAMKTRSLRLDEDDEVVGLSGPEVEADRLELDRRIHGLWTELTTQKLTAYITKGKIAPYFKNQKDLSEFIAVYARSPFG